MSKMMDSAINAFVDAFNIYEPSDDTSDRKIYDGQDCSVNLKRCLRAAIAALREPTPDILAARGAVRLPDRLDDADLWRMQIDAILKEQL